MSERVDAGTERWRHTFEIEQQRMWQTLVAHTRDPDLAADAVAEAFAQGIRRGSEVRDPAAWVWRSAFRIADGLLADRTAQRRRAEQAEPAREVAALDTLPDDTVALLDALERLHEGDRRLCVLALVGGFGSGEIGTLLGIRPGTVRVRLHRARTRLRAALADPDAPATRTTIARPIGETP